jgi:S1-C subfamily serine protease
MVADSSIELTDGAPASLPAATGRRPSRGLLTTVLALGVLLGFGLGWVAYSSPWGVTAGPPVLYDQEMVTSLFEDARLGVVEITVIRRSRTAFSGSEVQQDIGSGFLVDDAGHIVTNDHVVSGGEEFVVRLYDGRTLPAKKLGTSPADDLALLQVDPNELDGMVPLKLADSSKVSPGQLAIAIGSPFRQQNSITVGVVSGVERSQQSVLLRPIPDLIQTDAALNPGNSGGPLLNANGEVIGVNSSVRVVSMVQIGMGFAIPSNTLKGILPDLMSPGEIKRPWVGIIAPPFSVSPGDAQDQAAIGGVYISEVCQNSPAQRAGLRGDSRRLPAGRGDVITAVDGISVASLDRMVSYLNSLSPGDQITLTVLRDSESLEVQLTLAEWDDCE